MPPQLSVSFDHYIVDLHYYNWSSEGPVLVVTWDFAWPEGVILVEREGILCTRGPVFTVAIPNKARLGVHDRGCGQDQELLCELPGVWRWCEVPGGMGGVE